MAKHNKVGKLGEAVASKWLVDQGYKILEKNYRKKWGEIDIISTKSGVVHFIEVKTVSYGTREGLSNDISRETWRPEENVHENKIKRLGRAIETWISEKKYTDDWQLDVLAVRLVPHEKYAQVTRIDNVILE